MSTLNQRSVFLSASFPSGKYAKDFQPYDPAAIADAVTAVVRAVLNAEGRLVCGGHPTITPLVLMVASKLRPREAVDVFQSLWFEDQVSRETLDLQERGFGRIRWTAKLDTEEASLKVMREEMLGLSKRLIAGVFIGGMGGVRDECHLFQRLHPDLPVVSFAGPGGAAAQLQTEETKSLFGKSLNSRRYPHLASVLVNWLAQSL